MGKKVREEIREKVISKLRNFINQDHTVYFDSIQITYDRYEQRCYVIKLTSSKKDILDASGCLTIELHKTYSGCDMLTSLFSFLEKMHFLCLEVKLSWDQTVSNRTYNNACIAILAVKIYNLVRSTYDASKELFRVNTSNFQYVFQPDHLKSFNTFGCNKSFIESYKNFNITLENMLKLQHEDYLNFLFNYIKTDHSVTTFISAKSLSNEMIIKNAINKLTDEDKLYLQLKFMSEGIDWEVN